MTSFDEVESVNTAASTNSRHKWTLEEDAMLVESLHEIYLMGTWKADTGFKPGYLHQLEIMMERKMTGCGIKGTPHIDSRIRTLKKQTMALAEMLNTKSGFGWNREKNMIQCEQEVFDNWANSHPSSKGLRGRSFPNFDILNEIYGKDRANGKGATTPAAEEEEIEAGGPNEEDINETRDAATDGMEISDAQTHGSASESARKRIKKNADPLTEGIIEVSKAINKFVDGSLVYLSNVGQALKEDNTPSREVAKSLHNMEILTLTEVMIAAKIITIDEYMTSIFLELPQEKRVDMVLDLLKF